MSKRLANSIPDFPGFPTNWEDSKFTRCHFSETNDFTTKNVQISEIIMKQTTSKVKVYSLTSRDSLIYKDIILDKKITETIIIET